MKRLLITFLLLAIIAACQAPQPTVELTDNRTIVAVPKENLSDLTNDHLDDAFIELGQIDYATYGK